MGWCQQATGAWFVRTPKCHACTPRHARLLNLCKHQNHVPSHLPLALCQHPTLIPPPLVQSTQAVGQLTYIRPFVDDFSFQWLAGSACALVAGAMALVYIADTISELKLGNGTSVLIFANIASALPASVGALLAGSAAEDPANVAIYATAFFATTLGIIYVQVRAVSGVGGGGWGCAVNTARLLLRLHAEACRVRWAHLAVLVAVWGHGLGM